MKKLIILLAVACYFTSCVESLDDYNIDQKNAAEAPPATLFTNATKELADILTTPNVNLNNFRLYVQYWSTTTYLQEPRYDLTSRTIPEALWETLYRDVLADLKEARRLTLEDEFLDPDVKNNQLAQIKLMEVYSWFILVSTFGNIPYSQALDIETPLPVYDDAATVHDDLFKRLDTALSLITPEVEGFEEGDLLYEGDMESWAKFGNSLKLKMGMLLADVDNDRASTVVSEAAPNVFTSNADNALFPYISAPPNNNPVSANMNPLYSSRQDFIIAGTFTDKLNELNDPRRPFYATPVNGEYKGGRYGYLNEYDAFSHVTERQIDPTFPGVFLDYSEIEFLLAEAVERGFISGSAATHCENGIEASILYWGGSQADVNAYLAQPSVAYNTAPGAYKEKIGVQTWLALYNRGWSAWTAWRRLDYPALLPPMGDGAPAGLAIPVRYIYPINEQTLNPAQREAAASAIGGDEATTKLFWDVN